MAAEVERWKNILRVKWLQSWLGSFFFPLLLGSASWGGRYPPNVSSVPLWLQWIWVFTTCALSQIQPLVHKSTWNMLVSRKKTICLIWPHWKEGQRDQGTSSKPVFRVLKWHYSVMGHRLLCNICCIQENLCSVLAHVKLESIWEDGKSTSFN